MSEKKSPAECDVERLQDLVESPLAFDPKYAPERTARNRGVPMGLQLGVKKGILKRGMVVLDVGGGPYDTGTEYLAQNGIENLVYDPHARSKEHNNRVLQKLKERGGADAVVVDKVLNIIPWAEIRIAVLRFSYCWLKDGGKMIVTIYEGNKSGVPLVKEYRDGRYTWQANWKTEKYEDEIRKALPSDAVIEKISKAYIITKPALRKL